MKVIAFERILDERISLPPSIDIIPDSAITVPNRPLFLPDFSKDWIGRLYFAFRISRLGKDISCRFAPRYYDSLAPALRIIPASGVTHGVYSVFDSCVTIGEWGPITGENLVVESAGMTISVTLPQIDIDAAIEAVSRYATLKTGDIIMPCYLSYKFQLRVGQPFTARLNSRDFTVKIK